MNYVDETPKVTTTTALPINNTSLTTPSTSSTTSGNITLTNNVVVKPPAAAISPGNTDTLGTPEANLMTSANATMRMGEAVGYTGYPQVYVRSSSDIKDKTANILSSLMRMMGFDREELRYDRDIYINVVPRENDDIGRRILVRVKD